jgi:uncharacterized protein DUF4440
VTRRLAILLLLSVSALAGCGGSDGGDDPAQTVRDFVTATRERDADTFCGRLVTQEFLEQTTGATGPGAKDACKRELKAVRGLQLRLVKIEKTTIDGDDAIVRAVLTTEGRTDPRTFTLKREDGDWKLTGGQGR